MMLIEDIRKLKNLLKEADKMDGMLPNNCQPQKKKVFKMARDLGFVVGKNGNKIEIHWKSKLFQFNDNTKIIEMLIGTNGKIIVNDDLAWKIARIEEERFLGFDN